MKPLLLGNDLGMNIILKKEISRQIIGLKGLKNIIFLKLSMHGCFYYGIRNDSYKKNEKDQQ